MISEPVVDSDFNIGISTAPQIVINLGVNHVVWQDDNNTDDVGIDDDIFYRSISSILALGSPTVTPSLGNSSSKFNFTVTYIHRDNKPPTGITVNISGIEYSMFEEDLDDNNYMDGKYYFFNIGLKGIDRLFTLY